jgi:hypothetical protein
MNHIIIKTERRTDPARQAHEHKGQLHTLGKHPEDHSDPQFVMIAEWDGLAETVTCYKGDYSAVTMRYSGWPELDKETYDALYPSNPL